MYLDIILLTLLPDSRLMISCYVSLHCLRNKRKVKEKKIKSKKIDKNNKIKIKYKSSSIP